jgi:hypothetical protein
MSSALKELTDWLASKQKFEPGLELYKKYGTNKNLIRRFDRTGNNKFNRQLLFEQIKQMALTLEASQKVKSHKPRISKPAKPSVVLPATQPPVKLPEKVIISNEILPTPHANLKDDLEGVNFALLPDFLKKLSVKKGDLYREASKLHRELDNCKSFSEAAEKCAVILNNMRENDLIYQELRHFISHNKVLGLHPDLKKETKAQEPDYKTLPADQLLRKISSRSAQLSRLRKWMKQNKAHKDFFLKKADAENLESLIKKMRERLHAIQSK